MTLTYSGLQILSVMEFCVPHDADAAAVFYGTGGAVVYHRVLVCGLDTGTRQVPFSFETPRCLLEYNCVCLQ